ncbi:MAG: RNA polymerase sigma factor [Planctomycetota bacterium]
MSAALDELLTRAYRYALSLTHDATSAEDLVQEACVGLSRRGGPWHVGYLFAAVRNAWIDSARKRTPPTVPMAAIDHEPIASTETAVGLESAEQIDRLLGELNAPEREAVFLMVVEGYTAAEVADLTGCPRNTVLSRVHRGKTKLRRLLIEEAQR